MARAASLGGSAGAGTALVKTAQGVFADGKSAGVRPAALFIRDYSSAAPSGHGLMGGGRRGAELRIAEEGAVTDMAPLAVWQLDSIRLLNDGTRRAFARAIQAGTLAGDSAEEPLRFRCEPDTGERLTIPAGPAGQNMRVVCGWFAASLSGHEKKTQHRWVKAALAVWLVFGLLWFSGPAIFSTAAAIIPRSWEEALGEKTRENAMALFALAGGVNEAATESPALATLMTRLENAMSVNGYRFDLVVVDAGMVNAFALPGGYMLVTSALVRDCQSPEELAGVLGHEMAHVTERHGTGRVLREYAWSLLLRLASGSDSVAAQIAREIVSSSFSRDDEREADALGVKRAALAGIDPAGMAAFFTRLAKEESAAGLNGAFSYISTHPDSDERKEAILALAEAMRKAGHAYFPAMPKADWQAFRALCGAE